MRESTAIKIVTEHNEILKKHLDYFDWKMINIDEPKRKLLEQLQK